MTIRALRGAIISATLFGLVAITASGQGGGTPAVKNPIAATADSIGTGKQVYLRRCASCHGATGEGGPGNDLVPAAPSLVDDQWDHGGTDGEIFNSIKNGVPPDFNMVPFKDQLKDDEIWNVVNYIRSIARTK